MVCLGLAAANRHDASGLAHGATLHPHEESDNKKERQDDGKNAGDPVGLWSAVVVVHSHLLEESLISVTEGVCASGGELRTIVEHARDDVGGVIDGDFADITTTHLCQEFCVAEFLASWLCEQLASKCQNYNRADDGPDGPLWHRWLTVGIGLLVAQALDGVS